MPNRNPFFVERLLVFLQSPLADKSPEDVQLWDAFMKGYEESFIDLKTTAVALNPRNQGCFKVLLRR